MTRVVVPAIAGLSPTRQHDMFVLAAELAARWAMWSRCP